MMKNQVTPWNRTEAPGKDKMAHNTHKPVENNLDWVNIIH